MLDDQLKLAYAKIAHEIKNPIAIISSTLQLVELQFPEIKSNKNWKSIYSELDFISNVLNDFNDLNSIQNIKLEPLDFGELLYEIIDRLKPICIKKEITIHVDIPDEILNIAGDQVKLTKAITNLLKNAAEAVESNNFIEAKIRKRKMYALLSITDHGCGIPNNKLKDIFFPFYTTKENGTGLGLSIVSSIIAEHKGSIHLRSTPNKGTTFYIALPLVNWG